MDIASVYQFWKNPVILVRIQLEWFIPVDILLLSIKREQKVLRYYFLNGTTQSHSCFLCEKKIPVPYVRTFSPGISAQIVKAHCSHTTRAPLIGLGRSGSTVARSVQAVSSAWTASPVTKQANLRETVSVAEVATVCGFRSDGGIPSRVSLLVCNHYQVLWREVLQLPRSIVRSSQDSVLMSRALMSLLQTSLNLKCRRLILLCPAASFPQGMSFGCGGRLPCDEKNVS